MINDIDFSLLELKPDDVDFVIYHDNCCDGFGSAFSAYKYLHTKYPKREVRYYPSTYLKAAPLEEIEGKNVLICDFSYKNAELHKMLHRVKSLAILDHHKTAEQELKDIDPKYKIFRMDHSGAYITWKYFFRDEEVPMMIRYIEDNDIWTKKLDKTYEFTAYLFTMPNTFDEYEKMMDENFIKENMFPQGMGMVRQNETTVKNSIKYAAPKFVQIQEKFYFVAYLNATTLKSEIGHKIFNEYPNINFSAIYSINDYTNMTLFSLRSIDTATDVSEIAKILHGGGHRNASGCGVNNVTNILPFKQIDNHKTYFILENIYFDKIKSDLNNDVTIVYLNSYHYKHQLSKYLLQTRYIDKEGQEIQECVKILKNRDPDSNIWMCNVSVIWNYDGKNNCTWITMHSKDNFEKIKALEKYVDNYECGEKKILTFSLKGMNPNISDLIKKVL